MHNQNDVLKSAGEKIVGVEESSSPFYIHIYVASGLVTNNCMTLSQYSHQMLLQISINT